MFNFLILGLGPFVGNFIWPMLGQYYKVGDVYQFKSIFLWPSGIALAAAVVLAVCFRPPRAAVSETVAAH